MAIIDLYEAAVKGQEYPDIPSWYSDLIKYIETDPERGKKPLREKIKLFKQIQQKLRSESKNPSGWENWIVAFKAIIPYINIIQYFQMNGNQVALGWMYTAVFPMPSNSDLQNKTKYKSIINKMLNQTNSAISILERKLQLFDEDAAKQNPAVANQNILYKIDKHLG